MSRIALMLYSVRRASARRFRGDAARGRGPRLRGRRALRPARPRARARRGLARRARARRLRAPRAAGVDRGRSAGARRRGRGARLEAAVVSWVSRPSSDTATLARIAAAASAVAAHGLELGYHNHDAEVEQGFLERLPEGVFLELDAGWAWYAGADPVVAARPRAAAPHQGLPRSRRAFVLPRRRRRGRLRPHRPGGGARRRRVADRRAGRARGHRARGRPPLARGGHHHARGGRMNVGVVGCGVISRAYVENASAFDSFELVACADLDARRRARSARPAASPSWASTS